LQIRSCYFFLFDKKKKIINPFIGCATIELQSYCQQVTKKIFPADLADVSANFAEKICADLRAFYSALSAGK
jgi:hypothetical protein